MRAAFCTTAETFELRELPRPHAGPGDVWFPQTGEAFAVPADKKRGAIKVAVLP